MKLPKSLYTVLVFYKINTLRFFRDKLSIFFGIGFPLIFLFVFGGLNSGGGDISFNVALINQSDTSFSKQLVDQLKGSTVLDVQQDIASLDQARQKMSRSEIDAAIVLPPHFGAVAKTSNGTHPAGQLKVIYTQNNEQSGQALTSILRTQLSSINSKYVSTDVPFSVQGEQLNENSLSAFDYAFAGLLGFAIIGMGIFGPINVFPELKKMGILRRLSTTPLRVWQYFLSIMLGQATTGLLSIAIMFVVAITVFNLQVVGNYFELAAFTTFGIFMILGIGLALGGWAKNERQAAPLSNIIVFPMMFLSGTFFPRFLMPEWLQHVSSFIPLTPVIDGIRMIATEGKHLVDLGPQLGLMAIWVVIIYVVAFKVFRWE
jgi:ABC-2 type transport system permease protein